VAKRTLHVAHNNVAICCVANSQFLQLVLTFFVLLSGAICLLYRSATSFFCSHASIITYIRLALRSSMIPMLVPSGRLNTGYHSFHFFIFSRIKLYVYLQLISDACHEIANHNESNYQSEPIRIRSNPVHIPCQARETRTSQVTHSRLVLILFLIG